MVRASTALCGAATTFTLALLLRVGVGVGEAGCSPPAHSLISDYIAPARRATALSVYSTGISLGYIFGAVVGGYVALHSGWRAACVVVGLPGVVVALLVRTLVRGPPRGNSERPTGRSPAEPAVAPRLPSSTGFSLRSELRELGAVGRALLLKWPVANMIAGVVLASLASYGSYQFIPAYFNRAFGLDYATIGLVSGLAGGVSVGLGTLAGGFIADRLARHDAKWYALVPAIGVAIAMPLYALAFLQRSWQATALVLAIPGFFHYTYLGPTFGVVQNVVETRRRATASALLFMLLNVVALACGPPFTGWAIDHLAEFNFGHPGSGTLAAVASFLGGDHPVGESFRHACPGGQALLAAARARCEGALAVASREGILVTLLFYGWASVHYLLGAIGLAREMRAAAVRNAAAAG